MIQKLTCIRGQDLAFYAFSQILKIADHVKVINGKKYLNEIAIRGQYFS